MGRTPPHEGGFCILLRPAPSLLVDAPGLPRDSPATAHAAHYAERKRAMADQGQDNRDERGCCSCSSCCGESAGFFARMMAMCGCGWGEEKGEEKKDSEDS